MDMVELEYSPMKNLEHPHFTETISTKIDSYKRISGEW